MATLKTLYEDPQVLITEAYITIKKYYSPFGPTKTLAFNELCKISLEDAQRAKQRIGISTHMLNNWFSWDLKRKDKKKFICLQVKNTRVKPCFSPENPDKAFDILREHFVGSDRKSLTFESNRDNQTEIDQKQVNDMVKQEIQNAEKSVKEVEKPKQIELQIQNIE